MTGYSRGYRTTCGGHAHDVPGVLRASRSTRCDAWGLGAVPARRRGLYGARSLFVGEEFIHELAHAHRGADGPSLAFKLEDERVTCTLRLPRRLPLDRVERPHGLARHGVGVREDSLQSVAVSSSPQATAGVSKGFAFPLPSTRFPTAVSDRYCDCQSDRQNEVGDAEEADSYRMLETQKTQNACPAQCVQTR